MVKQETRCGFGRKKRGAKPRGRHAKRLKEQNDKQHKLSLESSMPIHDDGHNLTSKQVKTFTLFHVYNSSL